MSRNRRRPRRAPSDRRRRVRERRRSRIGRSGTSGATSGRCSRRRRADRAASLTGSRSGSSCDAPIPAADADQRVPRPGAARRRRRSSARSARRQKGILAAQNPLVPDGIKAECPKLANACIELFAIERAGGRTRRRPALPGASARGLRRTPLMRTSPSPPRWPGGSRCPRPAEAVREPRRRRGRSRRPPRPSRKRSFAAR